MTLFATLIFSSMLFLPRIELWDYSLLVLGISASFIYLLFPKKFEVSSVLELLFLFLLLTASSLLADFNGIFLHQSLELFFFKKVIRASLILVFLKSILERFPLKNHQWVLSYSIALLIHLFIIYAQLFFPEIKDFVITMFQYHFDSLISYRAPGLAIGYDVGGIYVVLLIPCLWNLLKESTSTFFKLILSIFVFFSCLATFFTARVAIVAMGFLFILELFRERKKIQITQKTLKLAFWLGVPLLSSAFFITQLRNEYIYAFIRSFDYNNYILDILDLFERFLIIPTDLSTFLVGNDFEPYTQESGHGDMAYAHLMWATGILGTGITLFLYFYLYRFGRKVEPKNRYIKNILQTMILLSLLCSIKGPYILTRGIFDSILFFWLLQNRTDALPTSILDTTSRIADKVPSLGN